MEDHLPDSKIHNAALKHHPFVSGELLRSTSTVAIAVHTEATCAAVTHAYIALARWLNGDKYSPMIMFFNL